MRIALALALTFSAAALAAPAQAAQGGAEQAQDQTASPYFVVQGGAPGVDALPLESTRADVDIAGTIARVTVTQVYKNAGKVPLEAIYVFPGSTRAAVFGMRMKVGDRTIVAQIQKKDDARKMYEEAKAAGKSASLLEQQRPNVFQMNVANILPGDRIEVQLDYTELLVPTEGTYTFVYPAVVGPRYTGESDKAEPFTATAHTHEGEAASYGWDLAVHLAAGLPIQRVSSSSHAIDAVLSQARDEATVTLPPKSKSGTKDFVLQFQLAGKAIQSGVLLYPPKGGEDGYFVAMVQPPATVAPKDMPKREYVFILDVSGSMRGFPLDVAKQVMDGLFKGLRPEDRFNILFFSGGNQVMSETSVPADAAHIAEARDMLAKLKGGGGTELLGALTRALALPTAADYARTFIAVTDGYVSVEPQAFELVRQNLGKANFFAFGIGASVNRHLIEGLARVGQGEPFFVMHNDDAAQQAAAFTRYIQAPALTRVKVDFLGFDAYDVEPAAVPDLFASRPVVVTGKYRGAAQGKIRVSGIAGSGPWSQALSVDAAAPTERNLALRYLWARQRIYALSDLQNLRQDDQRVAEITQLGLTFGLMTAYTSFIAVDDRVRNQGGESATVKQPLPLPDGVTDTAVAGSISGRGGYGGADRSMRAVAPRPSPALSRKDYVKSREPAAAEAVDSDDTTTPDAAPGKPAATLRTVLLSVSGGLAQGVVERVFKQKRATLEACAAKHAWHGGAAVRLVIGADGKVKSVQLIPTSGAPAKATACVEQALKAIAFPTAGEDTQVNLRLEF